jgi:hypothetical protein
MLILLTILRPKKNPIFSIELFIDKSGPRYNINYEQFESVLCSLFEKSISSTQAVPQLEKVNRKLFVFFFLINSSIFNLGLFKF